MKFSKTLLLRIFWFGIGGVASVVLNAGLFRLLHTYLGWSNYLAYGTSLLTINILQFIWNYHVGFTTTDHWSVAAKRQFVTLASANAINYGLVILFQGFFPRWPEAVIAVMQILISGYKFVLYHYWVYPTKKLDQILESAT